MKVLLNIFWHVPLCGFVVAGITWLLGGLLVLTVIAAPIGLGLMELGKYLMWPFGNEMVSDNQLGQNNHVAYKTYRTLIALAYILFIGWWMAAIQITLMIIAFITIIGIPGGIIYAKTLSTTFNPVGKKCVSQYVAQELKRQEAQKYINSMQNK